MLNIEKTIQLAMASGRIPGQSYLFLQAVQDGQATVIFTGILRPRATTQHAIVTVAEELQLPLPNADGVYNIKGQNIFLVRRAKCEGVLKHVNDLNVDTHEEMLAEVLIEALTTALGPVHRGTGPFDKEVFDTKLAAAFSSDRFGRNLPPHYNDSAVKAWSNTIVLDNVELDPREPIPQGWEGCLDLTTTPQSEKVGRVYTLAAGASIVNKKILPGNSILSELVQAGVFAPACCPTQVYKPWTTLRNHLRLVEPQAPMVTHTGVDTSPFQGRNLLTAIVHDKYNQLDQLTISESAAERMSGMVFCSETVAVTSKGSELRVREGDVVKPKQVLAVVRSETGESEIRARRLVREAVVRQIISEPRVAHGIKGTQHRIIMVSSAPLVSGDKLMPRSGCKGCVVVVPDSEMPEVQINGVWHRVEMTVNPFPVAKRKNLSMLLEMACNEAGVSEVPLGVTAEYLKQLFREGCGHKKPARRGEQALEFKIAAGHVFWMRSDSLRDYRTYAVSKVKRNFQDLNPDRGRNSGISYNPTFRMLLNGDKQCPTLDRLLMELNFNPKITPLCQSLWAMIDSRLEPACE